MTSTQYRAATQREREMNANTTYELVSHLTAAGQELFEDHDLGFPQTFEEFMRVMWQDDMDMKHWGVTREEYTDALADAYAALKQ